MIGAARLGQADTCNGLGDNETPRRIIESKLDGNRRIRRPKLRWLDVVVEDLRKSGIRGEWMVARVIQSWKRVLQEAEGHCRLQCHGL